MLNVILRKVDGQRVVRVDRYLLRTHQPELQETQHHELETEQTHKHQLERLEVVERLDVEADQSEHRTRDVEACFDCSHRGQLPLELRERHDAVEAARKRLDRDRGPERHDEYVDSEDRLQVEVLHSDGPGQLENVLEDDHDGDGDHVAPNDQVVFAMETVRLCEVADRLVAKVVDSASAFDQVSVLGEESFDFDLVKEPALGQRVVVLEPTLDDAISLHFASVDSLHDDPVFERWVGLSELPQKERHVFLNVCKEEYHEHARANVDHDKKSLCKRKEKQS